MVKGSRTNSSNIVQRIINTSLEIAAERGWRNTQMIDVSEKAGVALIDLYRVAPLKIHIILAYMREIDSQMVSKLELGIAEEPAKDRLFDLVMRRFDLLNMQKTGVIAVIRDIQRNPITWLYTWPAFLRSSAWVLECAQANYSGVFNAIQVKGLAFIMIGATQVWIDDDSEDMAKTMAYLDKQLGRADGLIASLTDLKGQSSKD